MELHERKNGILTTALHANNDPENHVDSAGYTRDDRDLIRLGKKPLLKVCLSMRAC